MSDKTALAPTNGAASFAPTDQQAAMFAMISAASRDPSVDVAKLQALWELKKEYESDYARRAFAQSLSELQGELLPVMRDADNPQTHSKYARLEAIQMALKPLELKHGFSVSFDIRTLGRTACVSGKLLHRMGHSETYGPIEAEPDITGAKGNVNKTELHGFVSTVSYLKRCLLCAIYNVPQTNEDDDGNAGAGRVRSRSRSVEDSEPLPPKPPAQSAWVTASERALVAETDPAKWLRLLDEQTTKAPTMGDLEALERIPPIVRALASAPPTVVASIKTSFMVARKRLTPAAADKPAEQHKPTETTQRKEPPKEEPRQFEAVLIDIYGEISETFTDPVSFASALLELKREQCTDSGDLENLLVQNADAIEDAKADAAAAKMLVGLEAWEETPEAGDAERSLGAVEMPTFAAVEPANDRDGKAWKVWPYRIRDALATINAADLPAWLAAQQATLAEAPTAPRVLAVRSIMQEFAKARTEVPGWLAGLIEPAKQRKAAPPAQVDDKALVFGMIDEVASIPITPEGKDRFDRLVNADDFRDAMKRFWKLEGKELWNRLDKATGEKRKAFLALDQRGGAS